MRQEERKAWFGRDGRLVRLPNPLQRIATRPTPPEIDNRHSSALETVFCPPNLPGPSGETAGTDQPGLVTSWDKNFAGGSGGFDNFDVERDGGGGSHCLLEVDVASVVFDHHHLFSLEHHLASKLRSAFATYRQALARRTRLDLDRRIRLLDEATEELKEKLEICVQAAEREFQVRTRTTFNYVTNPAKGCHIKVCPNLRTSFNLAGSTVGRIST
jgi:hypothetical protein